MNISPAWKHAARPAGQNPRPARHLSSRWIIYVCVLIASSALRAAEPAVEVPISTGDNSLHVEPKTGNDTNDGRSASVKTIARAIKLAQPGDTIHLAPGTYFESADLSNKHGEEGKPITLDGHGAVLDGSDAVTSKDWQQVAPDLYRRQHLYRATDDAIVSRWFLMMNGKMNRMGRCSKGPSAPLKKPDELQPNEWTFVKDEDAFYLRLAANQKLDQANIRYPARSSAVVESGSGSWLTVRNVTGTHVYNDGYNIHGAQRHTKFENIAAIECGDDGFSAHEDGDCHIDGFTSIGNATGLCDTGTSQTHYRNVFIKDCQGFDLFFIGLAHSMENALIESSAARAFMLDGARLTDGSACNLTLRNVLIRRVGGGPQELRIGNGGRLRAERCTFLDLNVTMTPGAAVDWQQCFFGGEPKPDVLLYANTIWRGAGNRFDLKSLRVGQTSFTPATFGDFQKLTGSDKDSKWSAEPTEKDAGADESSLQSLRSKAEMLPRSKVN